MLVCGYNIGTEYEYVVTICSSVMEHFDVDDLLTSNGITIYSHYVQHVQCTKFELTMSFRF